MTTKLKKIKENFKVKIVPSIIVTVCAIVLISGFYYAYAAWNTPVNSNQTLTKDLWNNMIAQIPQTCTSFTYSDYQPCQSTGRQIRIVTSATPAGCVGGNPVVQQNCTYTASAATWPTGSYCIIMASGAGSCPSGFNAVNPRRAPAGNLGAESGFIAGGNTSSLANTAVTWGMANTDPVNYQVWAWCCK